MYLDFSSTQNPSQNHGTAKKQTEEGKKRQWERALTFFSYSVSRSCRAWRTALHSCTMRSRRSSRVHEESAIKAAPLMMLSRRSSRDGRDRISSYARGSMIIFCWNGNRRKVNVADILYSGSKAAQSASDAISSVELISGLPAGSGSLFWMQSFILSRQMYLYTESPALYNHQRWFIVHLLLFLKTFYNGLFYVLFLQTGVHSPLQSKESKQLKQTSASRHALTFLNKGSIPIFMRWMVLVTVFNSTATE